MKLVSLTEELLAKFTPEATLTLKELYAAFPTARKDSLRGVINILVKKGKLVRTARSTYEIGTVVPVTPEAEAQKVEA
ncbi:MAG: hypothetical protein Q7R96_04635 [Nanoarchaeota archaeon]|nr:hypothetical protein [Nanoarchaeota archaeon]